MGLQTQGSQFFEPEQEEGGSRFLPYRSTSRSSENHLVSTNVDDVSWGGGCGGGGGGGENFDSPNGGGLGGAIFAGRVMEAMHGRKQGRIKGEGRGQKKRTD